jgi:capsular polysaccharide biosynthesis protein
MEIENSAQDLKTLKSRYEDYRKRVENTPQVEQKYRALQRDYANAQQKYQETGNRLLAAKEAKGLEESRMGEKFTLIDPPVLPEEPDRPNRPAILLVGFVLALGAGIGFGSLAEYMDQSVREADELTKISGHSVLAVIPFLETARDAERKRRKKWALVVSTVALIVAGTVVLHYVYGPLNILWIKLQRHIQLGF